MAMVMDDPFLRVTPVWLCEGNNVFSVLQEIRWATIMDEFEQPF
jgi:hypothetical protein